jgi:hypothetical protein
MLRKDLYPFFTGDLSNLNVPVLLIAASFPLSLCGRPRGPGYLFSGIFPKISAITVVNWTLVL